jgi:hypothetical protein
MHLGWREFARKLESGAANAPDSEVTAARARTRTTWAMCAVIAASTAALLGTSDDSPPQHYTTYTFERTGVDGGFVELTRDRPSATFFVTVHADELGPDSVVTTGDASVVIDGSFMTTGLAEGEVVPFVSVKVTSPDTTDTSERLILDHYVQSQPLVFTGDCANPIGGAAACAAHFAVELTRQDGEGPGVVRFDWLFDLRSTIQQPTTRDGMVGPVDPPWTIEVSQP